MELNFLKDDDLENLFAELQEERGNDVEEYEIEEDPEIQAAQRRYDEIIKKHKDE